MRIKSYYAHAVEDAMSMARQELGSDAMLINTRKAPPEARHLGDYELVFATDLPPAEGSGAHPEDHASGAPMPTGPQPGERLAHEVADLKKELEGMRRTLQRTVFAPAGWAGALPSYSDAYSMLIASDLDPEMAREILEAAQARIPKGATAPRTPSHTDTGSFRGPGRRVRIALYGRGDSRPKRGPAAHCRARRSSGRGQDHHLGEAGGELWPDLPAPGPAAVDG